LIGGRKNKKKENEKPLLGLNRQNVLERGGQNVKNHVSVNVRLNRKWKKETERFVKR